MKTIKNSKKFIDLTGVTIYYYVKDLIWAYVLIFDLIEKHNCFVTIVTLHYNMFATILTLYDNAQYNNLLQIFMIVTSSLQRIMWVYIYIC